MKIAQALSPTLQAELTALGERVRQLRIARRVTQAEVAVRAGISRTTLHQIENGSPGVAIGQVLRCLDAIAPGKTLAGLLTSDDVAVLAQEAAAKRVRARPLGEARLRELDF